MSDEFSAQYYLDMPADQFKAEAERLEVKIDGLRRNAAVDAVYNAELRRRMAEAAEKEAAQAKRDASKPTIDNDSTPYYESMTVAQLRDLAYHRDVDLGDAKNKADIIAALKEADTE